MRLPLPWRRGAVSPARAAGRPVHPASRTPEAPPGELCEVADVEIISLALAGATAGGLAPVLGPFAPDGGFAANVPSRGARLNALATLEQQTVAARRPPPGPLGPGAVRLCRGRLPARRVPLTPGARPLPGGVAAEIDAALAASPGPRRPAFGRFAPPWRG